MPKKTTKKLQKSPGIERNEADTFENTYKVPLKQWKKWGSFQRKLFNRLFWFYTENKNLFIHPKLGDKIMTDELWRTTAWNTAWIAADEGEELVNELLG